MEIEPVVGALRESGRPLDVPTPAVDGLFALLRRGTRRERSR
jgi:ketopantoate reductase